MKEILSLRSRAKSNSDISSRLVINIKNKINMNRIVFVNGLHRSIVFLFLLLIVNTHLRAAITLRGYQTNTTTNTTLTITKPTGLAVGDVMIAQIMQSGNNNVSSIGDASSTGWTQIAGSNINAVNRNYSRATLLYKIATSSDVAATNFSFTLNGNADDGEGGIVAFAGVDVASGPFDVTPGSAYTNIATDNSLTATAITTVSANAAILMFGALHDNISISNWTTTSPGTLTELYDLPFNADIDMGLGAAWALKSTAGSTGTGSASLGSSIANGAILIALKPAPAPTITGFNPNTACQGLQEL